MMVVLLTPPALARKAVESYVLNGIRLAVPEILSEELRGRAGIFVSIKSEGALRGCMGTIEPTADCIALEIIFSAINAATGDPRFPPVVACEIEGLTFSVDILMPEEPVKDLKDLDPERYGVIVRAGSRRGLLLPRIDGVDSAAEQVSIAGQKAQIPPGVPVTVSRFEVKRFLESA